MAISRRVIILVIIGILLALIIIGIFRWTGTKPSIPPSPTCQCAPDEICVNGTCIPKTTCGPQAVPDGEHCQIQNLLCDKDDGKWHCDGPGGCDAGFEGENCQCDMSKRPISNVCAGQIPVCGEDGNYTFRAASDCAEIIDYFIASRTSIDQACHNHCNGTDCGAHGVCQCQDYEGSPNVSCLEQCSPAPDPSAGECTSDHQTLNCPDSETCVCDVTTGWGWQCKNSFDPTPNTCPPIPPHPTYCPSGDLQCVPCVYQGQNGSVRYCPGSSQYPFDCLVSWFGLEQHSPPVWTSHFQNDIPVFPTVDNVRCEAGQTANTYLQSDLGIFYEPVKNPNGNVMANGDFVPFDSARYPYYVSSSNPANACLWTAAPDCSARGEFRQYCNKAGQVCSASDPVTSRLKDGMCECDHYTGYDGNQTAYKGCDCQWSDADCSGRGSASTPSGDCSTLICTCAPGAAGSNCQYTRATTCGGHGDPNSDGTCKCDAGYAGSVCQFNRATTCSGHGDPNGAGQCTCDGGWAGSNCAFNAGDPATAWVGLCTCNSSQYQCLDGSQTQDVNTRATCAKDKKISNQPCALGPDQNTAKNNCRTYCTGAWGCY